MRDGGSYSLPDVRREAPDLLSATVGYQAGERRRTQTFTARRIADENVQRLLERPSLRLDDDLDEDRTWIRAVVDGDR